jgi:D-alanyl-D-alanine carboxypeptidase/D-alanyl-D-alanine-endopeptidase (penicillin-binding protein 4)
MTAPPSRRVVLAGLLAAVAAGPAHAGPPERSLRPLPRPGAPATTTAPQAAAPAQDGDAEAEAIVARAGLTGAVGFALVDMRTGQLLAGRAPDLALPPASVAKAVTALFAIERLGAAHRFTTRLLATGPVVGGVLQGDLILSGSGDPTLATDDLGTLAEALRAGGIVSVAGRLCVHGAALPAIERLDADQPEHAGYNPAVSGLNLNYNRVHFEWRRAGGTVETTLDARGQRHRPSVGMVRVDVVDARDTPGFGYVRAGTVERWTVAAPLLREDGSIWLPVRQPELYAGEALRGIAAEFGIALAEPQVVAALPEGARTVAEHQSAPLEPMLREMLRHSTNLTAEVLGLAASGAPDLGQSARGMSDWFAARFGAAAEFVDHSGLGGNARISAAAMARALAEPAAAVALEGLLRTHPVAEMPKGVATPEVFAKTGTLNFVSGLGGYLRPEGGRPLAFAIFAADPERRAALGPHERERPRGARNWAGRAREMQRRLLAHWAVRHAG